MPLKKGRKQRRQVAPASSEALDQSNSAHPPFTIQYTNGSNQGKKRKRGEPETLQAKSDFHESLPVNYTIRPYDAWLAMKPYNKLSIMSQTIDTGEVIYVRGEEHGSQEEAIDLNNQWFGKILEIRAHDPQRVFVRIYWIYRPEDLPGGRRPYHGKNELIPSNHMDIIDAQTVNGKIELRHWTEMDDEEDLDADSVYWRQYFDYPKSTLSMVRKHCIDEAPYNPDTLLINCDNPKCKGWLHAECIEKAAIRNAYRQHIKPDHPLDANVPENTLSAEIKIQPGGKHGSRIIVTDLRSEKGQKWEEDLSCLLCHEKID